MRDDERDKTKAHNEVGFFELSAPRDQSPQRLRPGAGPRPRGGSTAGRPPFLEAGGHGGKVACEPHTVAPASLRPV